MISQTKWQTFSLSCVFVSAVLEGQIAVCSLLLLPVCFPLPPDSIRGYKRYLKELSWLHFLETTDSVGNLVLSLCDSEPAALRSVIYTVWAKLGKVVRMHFDLLCFALWFISEIEMVLFRIIFRAFEVGETRCGASRAASTLEMGHRDLFPVYVWSQRKAGNLSRVYCVQSACGCISADGSKI